jgi:hypothetical protein
MSHSFGHRPVYNADANQDDGSEFTFESERTISPEELGLIADQIDADLGAGASDNVGLISTKTGFRAINFGVFDNNKEFQAYSWRGG